MSECWLPTAFDTFNGLCVVYSDMDMNTDNGWARSGLYNTGYLDVFRCVCWSIQSDENTLEWVKLMSEFNGYESHPEREEVLEQWQITFWNPLIEIFRKCSQLCLYFKEVPTCHHIMKHQPMPAGGYFCLFYATSTQQQAPAHSDLLLRKPTLLFSEYEKKKKMVESNHPGKSTESWMRTRNLLRE